MSEHIIHRTLRGSSWHFAGCLLYGDVGLRVVQGAEMSEHIASIRRSEYIASIRRTLRESSWHFTGCLLCHANRSLPKAHNRSGSFGFQIVQGEWK